MNSLVIPLLGILVLERDPIGYADLPGLLKTWAQDAGGFAAVGLVLWMLNAYLTPPPGGTSEQRPRVTKLMLMLAILAAVVYACAGGLMYAASLKTATPTSTTINPNAPTPMATPQIGTLDRAADWALVIGGILAIIAIAEPFLRDLVRLRWRRIFALARISFKEAIRRRVLFVLIVLALPFLFPAKWFFAIKPEDELRSTVSIISFALSAVLLLMAGLMASFSIPNDVKNQTIHTIVTKPVERFEIVAGRFLGYTALMTLILFGLTALSLLFMRLTRIDQAAAEETLRARKPVYGKLGFKSRREDFSGTSVGREWEYRRYVAGGSQANPSPQRAIWSFYRIPSSLTDKPVPCEFAFDIFRTTKGEENKGVFCNFVFVSWKCPQRLHPDKNVWEWVDQAKRTEYEKEAREARVFEASIKPNDPRWAKVEALAEKYGFFEFVSKEVFDYHTLSIDVPAGLFKNALSETPKSGDGSTEIPLVQVYVQCTSPTQFIGVAPYDLYLLESEGVFELNFFKGAIGLWCRLVIVIGLATACSTYLSGVISFLVAVFLFIAGLFQEFVEELAKGTSVGGGPFEALNRLVKNETLTTQLDPTPTVQVALFSDQVFRWLLRRFINVIPDVENFDWTKFVSEGFDIRPEFLIVNLLFLIGYLLPWAILAYYLMKSREIAA